MERKQEQDTTDDRQKQGNPADETVIYKIGGTFYEVSTSCGGSEPLFEKMKRLIKSENLKAPTDKGKEVRYNEAVSYTHLLCLGRVQELLAPAFRRGKQHFLEKVRPQYRLLARKMCIRDSIRPK